MSNSVAAKSSSRKVQSDLWDELRLRNLIESHGQSSRELTSYDELKLRALDICNEKVGVEREVEFVQPGQGWDCYYGLKHRFKWSFFFIVMACCVFYSYFFVGCVSCVFVTG